MASDTLLNVGIFAYIIGYGLTLRHIIYVKKMKVVWFSFEFNLEHQVPFAMAFFWPITWLYWAWDQLVSQGSGLTLNHDS